MKNHQPVGENRPPQFSAPQNAGQQPDGTQDSPPKMHPPAGQEAPRHKPAAKRSADTPAATPPPPNAADACPPPAPDPAGVYPPPPHNTPNEYPPSPPGGPVLQPAGFVPAHTASRAVLASTGTKPRQPFSGTRADAWFAVACLVLGFLFIRWAAPFFGWGVSLFTGIFAAAVLVYSRVRRIRAAGASWFWMAVLLATGLSYGLWPGGSVGLLRVLLLFGTAIYWCGSLFGGLLATKTSNLFFFDMLNLLFVVPFRNYGLAFKGLGVFRQCRRQKKTESNGKTNLNGLYILLGLLLCIPVLALLLPPLIQADSGGFGQMLAQLAGWLAPLFGPEIWQTFWQWVLGFPVALYICGLVAGLSHKRYTANIDKKRVGRGLEALRVIPPATVTTVLVVVCVLYGVFILCQLPYFFSAFGGQRPPGYQVYSQLARDGFFELCRIAALNLGLLALACATCQKKRQDFAPLRWLSVALSALTLLLIATAFSKMALYIGAYGLTVLRVLVCVFLLFLALVCGAVILLQFRAFSVVRFSVVCGAVLVCLLCLGNPDGAVAQYNAARYLDGSLASFDANLVRNATVRGGAGAAHAARLVMENTSDKALTEELYSILFSAQRYAKDTAGSLQDTLANARIRAMELPE